MADALPARSDVLATGEAIARMQDRSGAIAWPDGHVDAWDHVECAMALSACGLREPARRAYRWLRESQRADGSWARSVVAGRVADPAAESHHAAYVAVGAWHEYLVTGDERHCRLMWPTVRRAVEWTLGLRTPRGEILWERDAAGSPGGYALLSGCASIHQSLRCAVALAKLADDPRPDWELAADRLGDLVARHPGAFADKSRFAMDWYYPVLGGAVRGASAISRLLRGWDAFVVPGLGVRCVSDQPWVTVAETCELVLALDACGMGAQAREMFGSVQHLRCSDGSYWTGWQFANQVPFPSERSSWTAAAVVLAADALTGFSGGAGIFRDAAEGLQPPDAASTLSRNASGSSPIRSRRTAPVSAMRSSDRSAGDWCRVIALGEQVGEAVEEFAEGMADGDGFACRVGNAGLPCAEFSFADDYVGVRGAELQQPEKLIGLIPHGMQGVTAHRAAWSSR